VDGILRDVSYGKKINQPPIIVLNVVVVEAEGLEAKDPNGERISHAFL
jgi:hypothetical protein